MQEVKFTGWASIAKGCPQHYFEGGERYAFSVCEHVGWVPVEDLHVKPLRGVVKCKHCMRKLRKKNVGILELDMS